MNASESNKRATSILVDSDDREDVHNRLAELIEELEDNWTGPVRIDMRNWDRYTEPEPEGWER